VNATILLVQDDQSLVPLIRACLQRDGFDVMWVRSGEDALTEFMRHPIALMVLDVALPRMSGLEVCRRVDGRVPVVLLTASDQEAVAGVELCADDYLAKPFAPRELVARVRAVLRRSSNGKPIADELELGPVTVSIPAREVRLGGQEIALTPKEFDLLAYLVQHAGDVVSRDDLLERVWGFIYPGETRTVEVHVAQLRKKLGAPELIRTVRGIGYKAVA
jgi:two-component system, OmpR family, alkaline phosphatase synthesis response regulator PhoP